MNIRLVGPAVAATTNINGRVYAGAPGSVYDVPDGDGEILGANGWVKICQSGPTSARPPLAQTGEYYAVAGTRFFDTTLSKIIVFDGATWRDPATGSSV